MQVKSHPQEQQPERRGLAGLHAYQVAIEFYGLVVDWVEPVYLGHATKQLSKAAESVVCNIGEGYTARGKDRARRFRIAENECSECTVALDLLERRRVLAAYKLARLRNLNDRLRAMLYRLSRKR